MKRNKLRESLLEYADQARLCRNLVLLASDAPLPRDLDLTANLQPSQMDVETYLAAMGFKSLVSQMNSPPSSNSADSVAALAVDLMKYAEAEDLKTYAAADSGSPRMQDPQDVEIARRLMLEEAADVAGGEEEALPEVTGDYVLVSEIEEVARIVQEARAQAVVAIEVMASSQAGQVASLMGVALATAPGRAYYLPVGHEQSASFKEAFSSFEERELVEALSPLVEIL